MLQTALLNKGSICDVVSGGLVVEEERIWSALEADAVADDVVAMPMKLETLMMEMAINMSGG